MVMLRANGIELPYNVTFERSGNTVTMYIDGQIAQQWIKEAVGLEDMDGNPLEDMDGNPLDGVG